MPRHWASTGPGGRDVVEDSEATAKYLSDVKPGEGCTITEIFAAMRQAGHGDLVDASVILRNRQEVTRQQMESAIAELRDAQKFGEASDVEILMHYGLGWTGSLRNRLEERIVAARNRKLVAKPKKKGTKPESIDFSAGDPVALMYPTTATGVAALKTYSTEVGGE